MKKILSLLFLAQLVFAQQDKSEIRLITRADDIGFCHAVNQACIQTYKQGIARSVEIIVPSPWFMEAVKMLKENPGYDVGVHLCLTSEWTNLKWRPMTSGLSIANSDGYFCPFIWPNDMYPKNEGNFLLEHNPKPEEVEAEFRKQIETAKKYIPQLSHLSAHMGCSHANEEIYAIVQKLAREYNLYLEFPNGSKSIEWGMYNAKSNKGGEAELIEKLKNLAPGTYHMVEHPGLLTPEMLAIYTAEGDEVAKNRQGVTDVWTSAKVLQIIKERKIKLISVKEGFEIK